MIVEDITKLKEWLITMLNNETIDADAQAVAAYAVALVKKDMAEEELKPAVCSDLSVFLAENTESFVTRLFQVVKDRSYMRDSEDTDNTSTTTPAAVETSEGVQRQESKTQDSEAELSDEDRDHRRTARRSPSNSPPPSRRRPSPHSRLGYNRGNRGYRGNSDYGGRGMRRDVRNRIGQEGYNNNRWHNGRPPRRSSRSPRHSLSPRRRSRSPRGSPPTRKSHSPARRSRSPLDLLAAVGSKPKRNVRRKCRDYEEKGFCLSGELCPFSHGTDAVVMTDVSGLSLSSTSAANQGVNAAPAAPNQPATIHPILPTVAPVPVEPYIPEKPRVYPVSNPAASATSGYMMGQPTQYPPYPGQPHPRQPHLRQPHPQQHPRPQHPRPPHPRHRHPQPMPLSGPRVPMMGQEPPQQMYRPHYPPPPRHQQPRVPRPAMFDARNGTLEVKNLPVEMNNISKLNEHFSKFGEIINLQVQYMSQPDTALITYSNHQSAILAHKNPEPVFNNRFIKIFWHNSNNGKQSDGARPNAKSRLGNENHPATFRPPSKPKVEPNMNRATLRLDKSAAAVNESNNSKKLSMEQKKQSLLLKYKEEQKQMVNQVETCADPVKKKELMKFLKQVSAKIEQLQPKDGSAASRKAAKELLDTELDIHQKRIAGEDTASLQTKLDALKRQAHSMGIRPARGRGGKSLPRPPPPKPSAPTAIVVMGFTPEEKDAVIAHFSQFGTVVEKEFVEGPVTSVVVEYSKANDAKVAATHGTKFGTKTLILKWYKPAAVEVPAAAAKDPSPTTSSAAIPQGAAASTLVHKPAAAEVSGIAAAGSNVGEQTCGKKSAASVSHDSVLDDDGEDLLATGEGNDEGDIDENLLLGDEDYEEDNDGKRSW